MLDQDQIDAPQFADGRQTSARHEPVSTLRAPVHPMTPAMAPLLFGATMMKAAMDAQNGPSILRGMKRRRSFYN